MFRTDYMFDSDLRSLSGRLGRPVRLLVMLALVGMLLISIIVYKAPAGAFVHFALYAVFYLQLPGLALLRILKVRLRYSSSHVLVGFWAGWALIIGQYFLCDFIGNSLLLFILGPLMSAFLVLDTFRRKEEFFPETSLRIGSLPVSFMLLAALVLLFALLNTQYLYLHPMYTDSTYMNADKAFHIGLIMSLADDYPLMSPQVHGRLLHYHIFSEVFYACGVRLFGITPDFMIMSAAPFVSAYSFCLGIYSLCKEFCRRKDRAGIYSLIILLSNLYLVRNPHSSIVFKFLITNDNVAGYGVTCSIAFLICFRYWYESLYALGSDACADAASCSGSGNGLEFCGFARNGFARGIFGHAGFFILLVALVMTATGVKGPMGAVLVGAVWGAWILGLIMKCARLRHMIPLLIISAGFLFVYVTVLGSKGQSNSSGDSIFAFATMTNISFWKKPLIATLESIGIPRSLRLVAILSVFAVSIWGTFFLPLVIGYLRELWLVLTRRKEYDLPYVVIYAAIFVGMVPFMVMSYSGHSQIYFGFIPIILGTTVAFRYIEDMEAALAGRQSAGRFSIGLSKAVVIISMVLLTMSTLSLASDYRERITAAVRSTDSSAVHLKYCSISKDEYDAMLWLRDNTDKDALVANDRYYSVNPDNYNTENRWMSRFFLYAIYSQRFQYIGGSGYAIPASMVDLRAEMVATNLKLYDSSNVDRGRLAREIGIDYLIVSKRFNSDTALDSADYVRCFENDDVIIFEVKQP